MTDTTVAERVARGVALLDEKRPGWAMEIELSVLDVRSPCFCILGQTFGSYRGGTEELDDGSSPLIPSTAGFDALTAEWVHVITDRRAGHEVTL